MADLRISQLPLTISPSLSDIVPVVNQGSTKKISLQQIQTFLGTSSYTSIPSNFSQPLTINTNYFVNVTTSSPVLTLPPTPPSGAVINLLVNLQGQNLTLNRNSQRINYLTENLVIDYNAGISLVYTGIPAIGWQIANVFEL